MSKKQNNKPVENNEATVNNNAEVPAVEETTKEGIGTKLLNGVKKHGKKVAKGAAIVGIGILGYALGTKAGNKGESYTGDDSGVTYFDDSELTELAATEEL